MNPAKKISRLIIAGSREYPVGFDIDHAFAVSSFDLDSLRVVLSGTARGIDRLGEQFAGRHRIQLERHPANWDKYGKSAGYRRNEQMAQQAFGLLACWDGQSRGTRHMIDLAITNHLAVFVYRM